MKIIKRRDLINWAVAVVITANSLVWAMPIQNAPLAIIMGVAIAYIVFSCGFRVFSFRVIFTVLFCSLLFIEAKLLQKFPNPYVSKYFLDFLVLGVGGLICSQTDFDPFKVIKRIGILSVFILPFLFGMDLEQSDETDYGEWMGISYACIKYVVALILLIFFIKSQSNKVRIFYFVTLAIYIWVFMKMASRGAVLAVFVSVLLFYMVDRNYKISKFLFISIVAGLTIIIYWDSIIFGIVDLLNSNGLHFYAFEKIIGLENRGNLSSGRVDIIEDALSYFSRAPILGNGVAIYEFYNDRYVHNVFIQALIEGGIVFLIFIIWWLVKAFRITFNVSMPKEQRYFMAFLIGVGFIELQFSNYFWRTQCFWFLLGYAMKLPVHNDEVRLNTL